MPRGEDGDVLHKQILGARHQCRLGCLILLYHNALLLGSPPICYCRPGPGLHRWRPSWWDHESYTDGQVTSTPSPLEPQHRGSPRPEEEEDETAMRLARIRRREHELARQRYWAAKHARETAGMISERPA